MTVAERIQLIRLLEKMEAVGEKREDGTIVVKDDKGNVLMEGRLRFKEH